MLDFEHLSIGSSIELPEIASHISRASATFVVKGRLDANDQRHADDEAPLPVEEDARRATNFAAALAEFLFVLPSRIQRGRSHA